MPVIWDVGNVNNVNNKKLSSKLTFDVGERFVGKIVKVGNLKNEVMIKLVDGWQFVAELDTPMEELSQGLIKFQVDGFENGKLKLKLVGEKDKSDKADKDVLGSFLESEGLSKEDGELIAKMIKHNMNLSRENVLKIKSIIQFQSKLTNMPQEGQIFINNYLASKGVNANSPEGKKIMTTLKEFFEYFKNINEEELLMFLENNIDLTKENIKSFENLFKNSGGLYKNIKSIGEELNEIIKTLGRESYKNEPLIKSELNPVSYEEDQTVSNKGLGEDSTSTKTASGKEVVANSEVMKTKNGEIVLNYDKNTRTNILNNIYNSASSGNKINMLQLLKSVTAIEDNTLLSNLESKGIEQRQSTEFIKEPIRNLKEIISLEDDKNNIIKNLTSHEIVKEQIKEKSEEIKTIIRDILNNVTNGDEELSQRIFQLIKNNISDFKVFNSISNEYYYMDLPLNLHEQEYPCKLIVKDDRKNGKRIDSTNVKMVISVDTINLGVVDGYLKVRDKNIYIDLKCKQEFVKAFSLEKAKLEKALEVLGYTPRIYVAKKLEPVTLTNCREFFNDNNISTINRMV